MLTLPRSTSRDLPGASSAASMVCKKEGNQRFSVSYFMYLQKLGSKRKDDRALRSIGRLYCIISTLTFQGVLCVTILPNVPLYLFQMHPEQATNLGAPICLSWVTLSSLIGKSRTVLSQKFATARSAKGLRVSVALPEIQPTPARVISSSYPYKYARSSEKLLKMSNLHFYLFL